MVKDKGLYGALPSHRVEWKWDSPWQLTVDPASTDAQGWEYARDFTARFSAKKSYCLVRRRRWTRLRSLDAPLCVLPTVKGGRRREIRMFSGGGGNKEASKKTFELSGVQIKLPHQTPEQFCKTEVGGFVISSEAAFDQPCIAFGSLEDIDSVFDIAVKLAPAPGPFFF